MHRKQLNKTKCYKVKKRKSKDWEKIKIQQQITKAKVLKNSLLIWGTLSTKKVLTASVSLGKKMIILRVSSGKASKIMIKLEISSNSTFKTR